MPWLEKHIEDNFVEWVEENYGKDWYCKKVKTFGRGWPDRIILGPKATVYFIEFKQPGEHPTRVQLFIHSILIKMGFEVYVCTSEQQAEETFRNYL